MKIARQLAGFVAVSLIAALCPAAATAQSAASRPQLRLSTDALDSLEPARPSPARRSDLESDTDTDDELGTELEGDQAEQERTGSFQDESGEPRSAVDADLTRDGVIDDAEIELLPDGADPTRDVRSPEDVAVFEEPPAGYDPLLFQIEDIEPLVTDRRPARLALIEPYDPIGIKIGTFVLFPEAQISGLATDNVFSSPSPRADTAAEVSGSARIVSNWSRHALELRGSLAGSFYETYDSENDTLRDAEVRARVDVSRRTNVQMAATYSFSQESRTGVDANRSGPRAEIVTEGAAVAFNHRFNRLSVQLRGAVTGTDFGATPLETNDDRDTVVTQEAVRARWELKPTLSPFAEAELNQLETGAPAPSDGLSRDSSGIRLRTGLDFGSTGQFLRGEISVGYGRQEPDARRLVATEAFLFDANVAWRPTELTSLLLTARTDLAQSTSAFTSGVVSRQIGLEARHALRRYVIASAGISYTDFDYVSSPLEESSVQATLGAEYFASPELVLFARYQHVSFSSNQANGDFEENSVRAGVRLRR